MPRFIVTETRLVLVTACVEAASEDDAREAWLYGSADYVWITEDVEDSQGLTITDEPE